jgi:hypothetical protein
MILADISWIAVLIGVILNMALGAFWYSPSFLGPQWVEAHGFRMEEMRHSPLNYVGAIFISLVTSLVIAGITYYFGINRIGLAVLTGFWLWLGLIATSQFSGVIWSKKPFKVFLIDAAYYLVSTVMLFVLFSFFA